MALEFKTWLGTSGVVSIEDFVLAARSNRQYVDQELIDVCGVTLNLAGKIAVRKAWYAAENAVNRQEEAAKRADTLPENAPISPAEAKNLHEAFSQRHSFKLGSKRLLADDLQGRLLRELTSSPKRLKLLLPEQLRGAASFSQAVGTSFSVVGGVITPSDLMAPEDFGDTIELYRRIRSLCNTLSLLTIPQPDWFPFMVGEELCDQLLEWMNQKYDGKRLPLKFYVQAYVSTFSAFIDAVRTHNTPLAQLAVNTSTFRSYWVNYAPPAGPPQMQPPRGPPPQLALSGHPGQPDNSREIHRLREANAKLHARVDSVASSQKTLRDFGGRQGPQQSGGNRGPTRRGGGGNSGSDSSFGTTSTGRGGGGGGPRGRGGGYRGDEKRRRT